MLKELTFGKICFFMGLCIISVCIGINCRVVDGMAFFGGSLLTIGSITWLVGWLMHPYK